MVGRKQYYVYIMTNRSGTLYTGVTSDLERRMYEHKQKLVPGFTKKYNIDMLVYFEGTSDVYEALNREKRVKDWRRSKRVDLIESMNPDWRDLSDGWFGPSPPASSLRSE
ncbi:MAG: GIY-YIG nuclease family protein [Dehalococcoidia bacterium]